MGDGTAVSSRRDAFESVSRVRDSSRAFAYSEEVSRSGQGRVHQNLSALGVVRECLDTEAMPNITPIAIGMDVTRSRGNDAKTVYSLLHPMLGAMYLSGSVVDPQILFAAIGDAKSDRAPLQVGQFESSDAKMDNDLGRLWIEEGGGGTGEESYELFAYFLARKTKVDAIDKRGDKGFCFFTGDEAPYPTVSKEEVKRLIGDDLPADIATPEIFAELQQRYRTYLLYPGKSMEDRKDDIDAEIRQRLLKAGGRFENCSIRASLIWNTRDDLDLHVVTPGGDHIYFGHRLSSCGGELDVDRNVHGETREPVENIRWPKGTARPGKYTVFVQNYGYHEAGRRAVRFKVELDIDGEIKTFDGEIEAGATGPRSDVTAFEFDYLPAEAVKATAESRDAYTDEVILSKWRQCIPDGHIIRLTDAKWTTEAAVGVMAIQKGKTLDQVIEDMRLRAVPEAGLDEVRTALAAFARQAVVDEVREDVFS